jgi:hypothetical protein
MVNQRCERAPRYLGFFRSWLPSFPLELQLALNSEALGLGQQQGGIERRLSRSNATLDGFGLMREIRALGPDAGDSVPVVTKTACLIQGERASILDAGF